MQLNIQTQNGISVAILEGDFLIESVQDAVDLLGNADYQGARKIIIREEHLSPDFFILRTQLAGDILQKFSNYRMQLAIVGDFSRYESKSLQDFIRESNRTRQINFIGSPEEAMQLFCESN